MGVERRIVQKRCFFLGKHHDNQILKVQILLSRNVVVMAQAPSLGQCWILSNLILGFDDSRPVNANTLSKALVAFFLATLLQALWKSLCVPFESFWQACCSRSLPQQRRSCIVNDQRDAVQQQAPQSSLCFPCLPLLKSLAGDGKLNWGKANGGPHFSQPCNRP